MQHDFDLITRAEQAAAALHPLRSQLLEQFREPQSAAAVARNLELPRQRIGHHVRLLQEQGLLVRAGERRRGAFTEILLQTTARAWAISPGALGAMGMAADEIRDRFSSEYLAVAAARTLRDVGTLRDLADQQGKRLATLTVETEVRFANATEQAAFAEELTQALTDLVARYHDATTPGGRRFRFMMGGHPVVPVVTTGEADAQTPQKH
jgi:hypothetical protein